MLRDDKIRLITDALTKLQLLLRNRTVARLTDLNVAAEDLVRELLNNVYDLNLRNLNVDGVNFPAVDLADATKRIAFQVTTEFRAKKIQTTIDTFAARHLKESYDRMCVIILGEKQRVYSTIKASELAFDAKRDVLDIKDLIRLVAALDEAKLTKVAELVKTAGLASGDATDSDEDAIRKLHSEFDRDALKHHWHQEGSIGRFSNSLTELTELLGKGTINGQRITIPISQIRDPQTRAELNEVRDALSALRAAYNARVNSKEIREDQAFAFFKDRESANELNSAKAKVLASISKAGRRYSLRDIRMLPHDFF